MGPWDNLSANWVPDIRAFADANRIELVPTPAYASYLNRIESHFRPIREFVFNNTDYRDWDAAQRSFECVEENAALRCEAAAAAVS